MEAERFGFRSRIGDTATHFTTAKDTTMNMQVEGPVTVDTHDLFHNLAHLIVQGAQAIVRKQLAPVAGGQDSNDLAMTNTQVCQLISWIFDPAESCSIDGYAARCVALLRADGWQYGECIDSVRKLHPYLKDDALHAVLLVEGQTVLSLVTGISRLAKDLLLLGQASKEQHDAEQQETAESTHVHEEHEEQDEVPGDSDRARNGMPKRLFRMICTAAAAQLLEQLGEKCTTNIADYFGTGDQLRNSMAEVFDYCEMPDAGPLSSATFFGTAFSALPDSVQLLIQCTRAVANMLNHPMVRAIKMGGTSVPVRDEDPIGDREAVMRDLFVDMTDSLAAVARSFDPDGIWVPWAGSRLRLQDFVKFIADARFKVESIDVPVDGPWMHQAWRDFQTANLAREDHQFGCDFDEQTLQSQQHWSTLGCIVDMYARSRQLIHTRAAKVLIRQKNQALLELRMRLEQEDRHRKGLVAENNRLLEQLREVRQHLN